MNVVNGVYDPSAGTCTCAANSRAGFLFKAPISSNAGELVLELDRGKIQGRLYLAPNADGVPKTSQVPLANTVFAIYHSGSLDDPLQVIQYDARVKAKYTSVATFDFFGEANYSTSGNNRLKFKLQNEKMYLYAGRSGADEDTVIFEGFMHTNSATYAMCP